MTVENEYLILAFKTTADAMCAEKYLKEFFSIPSCRFPGKSAAAAGLPSGFSIRMRRRSEIS